MVAAEDPVIAAAAASFGRRGVAVKAVQADLATHDGVERLYAALRGRTPDAIAINAGADVSGDFAREHGVNRTASGKHWQAKLSGKILVIRFVILGTSVLDWCQASGRRGRTARHAVTGSGIPRGR